MNEISVDNLSQLDLSVDSVVLDEIKANTVVCTLCDGSVIKANAHSFILKDSSFLNNTAF